MKCPKCGAIGCEKCPIYAQIEEWANMELQGNWWRERISDEDLKRIGEELLKKWFEEKVVR